VTNVNALEDRSSGAELMVIAVRSAYGETSSVGQAPPSLCKHTPSIPRQRRVDVRTDSKTARAAGDASMGSDSGPCGGRRCLMGHQHLARYENDGALLAVPLRIRGRKAAGDEVTVEFTFDPEDED
jgi:hypothetical protein